MLMLLRQAIIPSALLLEPVLASLWTWLFLGEAPPLHVVPGAALVLGALALEYVPRERAA